MKNVPLAPDVDVKAPGARYPGLLGRRPDANLVNESALMAARRNKRVVTMQEFEDAKDKVMMGAERRSMAMTEAEKKLTAYHEAGHAIVALNVPVADPLHKATIIPRGRALGMVMQLPEGDRYSMSYDSGCTSRLAIMMGGRVAEEIIFGKENITSGASSDIEQYATKPCPQHGDPAGAFPTSSARWPMAKTSRKCSLANESNKETVTAPSLVPLSPGAGASVTA
jgi:cell division protease FtsH